MLRPNRVKWAWRLEFSGTLFRVPRRKPTKTLKASKKAFAKRLLVSGFFLAVSACFLAFDMICVNAKEL